MRDKFDLYTPAHLQHFIIIQPQIKPPINFFQHFL